MKSIIYYTDNRLGEPLFSLVQKHIKASGLPITSSSLAPIDFGDNEVVSGERCYTTMVKQIISCLERATSKYVFFCENDVLYHKSHFDFTPPKDDIFYYNENVWRWQLGSEVAVRYDRMLPLSVLSANREFVLDHYKRRLEFILERGFDKVSGHEPKWVRVMGYEPGTKKKRRGGFTNDYFETWSSEYPNIDIRHSGAFSNPKVKLSDFKHEPKWWKEIPISEIISWNLKEI